MSYISTEDWKTMITRPSPGLRRDTIVYVSQPVLEISSFLKEKSGTIYKGQDSTTSGVREIHDIF